jgi:hypothetical protein
MIAQSYYGLRRESVYYHFKMKINFLYALPDAGPLHPACRVFFRKNSISLCDVMREIDHNDIELFTLTVSYLRETKQ